MAAVDARAAGIATVVPRLCQALGTRQLTVTLASLGGADARQCHADHPAGQAYRHALCPRQRPGLPVLYKLGRSPAMAAWLAAEPADVYHTHGLWMMPNVYPAAPAKRQGRPFVLSPHGMLAAEALGFSAGAKRMFWEVWQRQAFAAVSCFHATATSEYEEIRTFGCRKPVAIIPHGIDLPPLSAPKSHGQGAPYVLALGRLHPKKGLDRLVAAWREFSPLFPTWRLRIVGPDEGGHAAELAGQIASLGLRHSVTIEPAIDGQAKTELLRGAELFVLSSLNENFGMTVAESLAVETPVISTRGAPWQGLVVSDSGWWIEHGVDSLVAALRTAAALPVQQRHAMGVRGRQWMAREFTWPSVAARMRETYHWLVFGGPSPSCVRLD